MQLGKALLEQNRVEDAIAEFRAILVSDPQNARAYYNLARALEQQGDTSAAREMYQRALELARAAGRREFAETIERRLR